jgi:hypothetical protein
MCGAPKIGEGGMRSDACRSKALDHVRQHDILTTMKMSGAVGIDYQSVRGIGGSNWCVALQRPKGEAFQRGGIRGGIGIHDDESRHQGLGLGGRHANKQASAPRDRISCKDHPPSPVTADQDERRFRRRRAVAQCPSDPICRPCWKEERDDPWHRKPPLRNQHSHLRDTGSVRAAIGRVRRPAPARGLRAARRHASG